MRAGLLWLLAGALVGAGQRGSTAAGSAQRPQQLCVRVPGPLLSRPPPHSAHPRAVAVKPRSQLARQSGRLAARWLVAAGLLLSGMPGATSALAATTQGLTVLESTEAQRIFSKARQCESDGNFKAAQGFYEQVVEAEPTFIYAWANLANVLVSQGNLEQALLCYKKAITLQPPRDQLGLIVLNRASVEMSLNMNEAAIRDLTVAEKLSGATSEIVTTRAVALTNEGNWPEAVALFERIISTSDRDALPWWLRYSESLLETSRGTEAVAFLQRTLNRFPYEDDCKAFAVALYSSLGSKVEAQRYWGQMDEATRAKYSEPAFYTKTLKWGPKTIAGFSSFLSSKYAAAPPPPIKSES